MSESEMSNRPDKLSPVLRRRVEMTVELLTCTLAGGAASTVVPWIWPEMIPSLAGIIVALLVFLMIFYVRQPSFFGRGRKAIPTEFGMDSHITDEVVPHAPGRDTFKVPRALGIKSILILTLVLAAMTSVFAGIGVSTEPVLIAFAYVGFVGLAQMWFQRTPRRASIVTGAVLMAINYLLVVGRGSFRINEFIIIVAYGALVGYAIGIFLSGLYLLASVMEFWWKGAFPADPAIVVDRADGS